MKIKLSRHIPLDLQMDMYRQTYAKWKQKNKRDNVGFFQIFNTFKSDHLANISGGALKAYVYFGIHANNKTGESWHSIETLSEYFQVDPRTIKKWISELEDLGLISRVQKGYNRIANTFLMPYFPKSEPQQSSFNKYELAGDWTIWAESSLLNESDTVVQPPTEVQFSGTKFSTTDSREKIEITTDYSMHTVSAKTKEGSIEMNNITISYTKNDILLKQIWIREHKKHKR